jgi:hypothetical protein
MSRNHFYQVNDFIDPKDEPISIVIDKKISILYDFEVLISSRVFLRDDPRESAVREWLNQYQTERQLDVAVRDLITGAVPLNTFLKRKGLM